MLTVLKLGICAPSAREAEAGGEPADTRVAELAIRPVDSPAGPEMAEVSPNRFVLNVPAGWVDLREKALATLRRTVTTAALDVGRRVRPAVVYATDVDLCGVAAAAVSRLLGCPLVLGLTADEVEAALFDERKVAVLEPALAAARAVAVADRAGAELLAACHPALSARVTAVPALSLRSGDLRALLARPERKDVPWARGPEKPLAVSRPSIAGPELRYVEEVLRSGWWGYGPVAHHLEGAFAAFCGGGVQVLAVSSCTAALHLALLAAGVGPGDEVIVPALTFVATVAAVAHTGATPRFADVDPETLSLLPESVERELSGKTRVILPVDFAGVPADLPALAQLAANRGITLIEDAAHAMGSLREGRRVGTLSPFTCFSFAPTKQIPSCSGGLLVYQDPVAEAKLRELSNLGLRVDTRQRSDACGAGPANEVVRVGYRYRMDDVSAAIAVAQLEALATTNARRGELVARYRRHLEEIPGCEPINVPQSVEPSWYILPVRVPEARRDPLREHLASQGIDSSVHYPSLLEQPAFSGFPGHAPVAARESRRLVSLPLSTTMTCADVDRVCESIAEFLGR